MHISQLDNTINSFNLFYVLFPESSDSDDDNTGAIIGAVVGGIVGIIIITLLLLMIFWCYCKMYKKESKSGM